MRISSADHEQASKELAQTEFNLFLPFLPKKPCWQENFGFFGKVFFTVLLL